MEHRDPVAEVEGLLLLVGDEHGGDAHPPDRRPELAAGALAQGGIEVRERLVEQQHARLGGQGAGERHPLLLAARDLPHPPVREARRGRPGRAPRPPGGPSPPRLFAAGEAEGDVLAHGQVGEEGVVLEDHAEVAALGREAR